MNLKKYFAPLFLLLFGFVPLTFSINIYYNTESETYNNSLNKIVDVALGDSHSLVLTEDKQVYSWGRNNYGQLGQDTQESFIAVPRNITSNFDLENGEYIVSIEAGGHNSAAISSTGDLYTWGSNAYGQIGNGENDKAHSYIPEKITIEDNGEVKEIKEISIGSNHSIALTSENKLYVWGDNQFGQLGNGTTTHSSTPIPMDLSSINNEVIIEVETGENHNAILTDENNIFMWGDNKDKQINDSEENEIITEPIEINENNYFDSETISSISLGGMHSMVLTEESGNLYAWGSNSTGQLGLGIVDETIEEPTLNENFNDEKIIMVSNGHLHSVAISENGNIYSWGNNSSGQLGIGNKNAENKPIKINSISSPNNAYSKVFLGSYHSMILTSDNKLYVWGKNEFGQLGNDSLLNIEEPYLLNGDDDLLGAKYSVETILLFLFAILLIIIAIVLVILYFNKLEKT